MTIYAKVRPVVDAAAAEAWGRILSDKLDELRAAAAATAAKEERLSGPPFVGPKE